MKKLIVLKLGGSIITAKREGKPIIKRDEIARIAREIKAAQNVEPFNLILIHGVGSFGHALAKKYELWKGIKKPTQILPFARTQYQTIFLNNTVAEIFVSVGLPVIALNPTALIVQKDAKLSHFNTNIAKHFLISGFIPVLYGTVVPDEKLSGSICSGDTMVTYLSKKLNAESAVFATDVDGVFTGDPNLSKDALIIREITNKNYQKIMKGVKGSASKIDIGGGMRGKIEEIRKDSKGIETWIINGQKKNAIKNSLLGKSVIGTRIFFK